MKKELLLKIFSTSLFIFFATSMFANAPATSKRIALKHRVKSESTTPVCENKKMAPLELKMLTRTSALSKAPEETIVEYPDSTVIFTPQGEKIYATYYEYDANNRVIHQTEVSLTTANTWVKVDEKIVEYDQVGRPLYNEFYQLINNVWTGTLKGIVKYDEYGNQVYKEVFWWNPETGSWSNSQKEISEYRPDGKPIMEEGYYWQGDSWGMQFHDTYEYNEQGLVIKYTEYEEEDGELNAYYYIAYEYDAVKTTLQTLVTEYELNYDTNEFVATAKCTRTYNDKDEEILALWMAADEENEGEWVNDQKIIHEYTNGKQTMEEGYRWVNGEWKFAQRWEGEFDSENREIKARFYYPGETEPVLSSVYTHEYDANGNLILEMTEATAYGSTELVVMVKKIYKYDEASRLTLSESYQYYISELVGVSKEVSTYTGHNDDLASYESYIWKNNGWFPYSRDISTYENNLLKEVVRSEGGEKADEWVETIKFSFTYNDNNLLIREDLFKMNDACRWERDVYLIYYYPSTVTGFETNRVSQPNISVENDLLTVTNLTGNELIHIYNVNGQLMQSIKAQENRFSTSLPQGIYIIAAGNVRGKIIIK